MASVFTSFLIKKFTPLGKTTLIYIFRNRIEIKEEIPFWKKDIFFWNDIKKIEYQREITVYQTQQGLQIDSDSPVLLVYFHDGKFVQTKLSTNYEESKKLLEALEKISHSTEVTFYSENWEELQTMKNIKLQSKGNIEVEKPKKVFDANTRPVYPRLYS
jgi:hypothetical protein